VVAGTLALSAVVTLMLSRKGARGQAVAGARQHR
jgi:ACS family tartrate transporter-like MFS transporter